MEIVEIMRMERRMNQKFGDLYAKFLMLFAIWVMIAFIFEIGY